MTEHARLLPVAREAVALASDLLRTRRPGGLTAKGDRDIVTEVDYAIERQVRDFLHMKTPDVGFLGEEEGASGVVGDLVWALDPIDGTINFVHGLPFCGVSLGLVHRNQPVLGVIELPFFNATYSAVQGAGAFKGDQRISASRTGSMAEAVVTVGDYAVGFGADRKNALRLAVTTLLAGQAQRVRMFGSTAVDLAWLAEGRTDASIVLSNKPWDMAAGVILALEAGARVVDHDGSPHSLDSKSTIATAEPLLAEVLRLVGQALANGQG